MGNWATCCKEFRTHPFNCHQGHCVMPGQVTHHVVLCDTTLWPVTYESEERHFFKYKAKNIKNLCKLAYMFRVFVERNAVYYAKKQST